MVIEIRGDKVRLGIEAPRDMPVHRQEVHDAIQRENAAEKKAVIDGAVKDAADACRPFHRPNG